MSGFAGPHLAIRSRGRYQARRAGIEPAVAEALPTAFPIWRRAFRHWNFRRVEMQSAWKDSNLRSRAAEARAMPDYATRCAAREERVVSRKEKIDHGYFYSLLSTIYPLAQRITHGWIRTIMNTVNSRSLYRLSYMGIE